MATRLQEKYTSEVCKGLMEKFNYKNVNELPKLEKVVINIGCGDAVTNSKAIDSAVEDLTVISGQKPLITKAKKSIAAQYGSPDGPLLKETASHHRTSGRSCGSRCHVGPARGHHKAHHDLDLGYIAPSLLRKQDLSKEKTQEVISHFLGLLYSPKVKMSNTFLIF